MATLAGFRDLKAAGSTGVWEAFNGFSEALNRQVAVTVVRAEVLRDEVLKKKFAEMAEAASKLTHPMLARTLHSAALPDGRWSVSFEQLSGESLQEHLDRDGPLTLDDAVQLTLLLCEAVDAAHQRGVLHGDICPANIVLVGGLLKPRLKGFVLGLLKGATVGYSAPELQQRKEPTALSDVYSLGA